MICNDDYPLEGILQERGPVIQRKSPITLSERGTRLLNESGAKKFVDAHLDELLKTVKERAPATDYDIQEEAQKVIKELQNDPRLNPIKDFLFKDGSTLDEAITVMGIYLRDHILEKRPSS